ncbi:hypothetical protein GGS23DRAFT_602156 [Durotheca rogersii]|uniref:uncharacterized protein n=1 Tax=Durotheca rogersii TaxID=419775 RepID=UPI00221F24AF|nr:uncharacterized protein GGS23DRAFT_602156 [Durotheca rogersii]KAI5868345.1 hypothetical protein GGS23DRAFT_602156 [Durotheca rogersii]
MIERSITTDCITLGNSIAKANLILSGFVRDIREARSDVDAVSRELYSLQSVLDLLREDAGLFPLELAERIPAVLEHCSGLVNQLDVGISSLSSSDLLKEDKRSQWLSIGRREISKFKTALEAHKGIIGLALDLVGATTIRDATSHVVPRKRETIQRRQNSVDIVEDVSRVLVEMDRLRLRLPGEFEKKETEFTLYDYMACLVSYAERIISIKESEHEARQRGAIHQGARRSIDQGAFVGEDELFGAYVGDKPDSAIDVSDEPIYKTIRDAMRTDDDSSLEESISEESIPEERIPTIEELMATFDGIPSRAPTPPPKDAKRLETARSYMVPPFEAVPDSPTVPYGVVAETGSPYQRTESPSSFTRGAKGLGKLLAPIKNAISDNRPQTRSTSSSAEADSPTVPPMIQASLVRRSSHRLSVSFKRLPLWSPDLIVGELDGPQSKPNPIFGVPLQKSMQVAKGSSKTHHTGNGGSSRRDFPLCMQKCCFFVKNEGVEAPDIFAEPGDGYRVQKLKELFSAAPTFGEDIDWKDFSVYDAADLMLLFLSELPKPLVPEPLAKRWISLSRQLTLGGSHGTRLDQCIDFWEEALGGLRGPDRSLFKLLLNLWADIAVAEDKNDMTAERLAAAVIKPLMQISSGKYKTDYMLSLAFLIRKRVEYIDLLKKDQSDIRRISRAAW